MEESIKWDDSRDEIMDIIEVIESNKEPQIPIKCPMCNTNNAHIYMHRWENNRGTIWTWCSNCKSCTHASRQIFNTVVEKGIMSKWYDQFIRKNTRQKHIGLKWFFLSILWETL